MQTNEKTPDLLDAEKDQWDLTLYVKRGYSWEKAVSIYNGEATAAEAYETFGSLAGSALPPWAAVVHSRDEGVGDYELRLSSGSRKRLMASATWPADVVSYCVEDLASLASKTFLLEVSVDAPMEMLESIENAEEVDWLELMETGALEVLSAKEKVNEN